MTCWEKYIADKTWVFKCIMNGERIPPDCPSHHGYLDDPTWCDEDGAACRMCWEREIPGTENKEKENEDMTCAERKANGFTPKATCSLNYEAEYERLLAVNKELNAELEKANKQRELDLFALRDMRNTIEMYEFGFHIVEAFLGRGIMDNLEDEF